jgi:PAS domain S-box-containing protein
MFPRQEIGDRLWTLDEQLPTDATIKSHIRSLRRKLEQAGIKDMIQTHYRQGYCLNPTYEIDSQLPSPIPQKKMDSITAHIWQELMTANARLKQEIDQRREVETQLRRSETMLRNAQRIAQVGCWYADIQTQEIYWTEELFLIHGLVPSRQPPSLEEQLSLIHPDDRQIYEEAIRTPAIRKEKFEANLRIIRADNGEVRYINARGGPLYDTEGKVIKLTGTTLDLTRSIMD